MVVFSGIPTASNNMASNNMASNNMASNDELNITLESLL